MKQIKKIRGMKDRTVKLILGFIIFGRNLDRILLLFCNSSSSFGKLTIATVIQHYNIMSSSIARRVYILTFITYALIHGVRTCWSYIKTYSQKQPLEFSTQFLGQLDMVVLICLAVSLKTLGWVGEKIGYKNFLLIGMSYLTLSFMLMGVLQLVGIKHHWVYILLYAMVGVASCTGWPSCLSIVSQYYPAKENGFKLCIWNGCSQFGDFVALALGYLLIEVCKAKPQSLILTMCGLIMFMIAINWFFLEVPAVDRNQTAIEDSRQQQPDENKSPVERPLQKEIDIVAAKNGSANVSENNSAQQKPSSEPSESQGSLSQQEGMKLPKKRKSRVRVRVPASEKKKVNFLNVWLLPSVASYVLCFACLKSVNAVIMSWLLFYLFSIGLHKYSGTITVSWSICVFTGSLLMGYYNNSVNKIGLIVPLLFTGFIFSYLGVEYEKNNGYHYLVMMILSGLCFGGPFGLIGSKITLLLGKNPKIRDKQGAVGAIISVMQGFGQFTAAFFVLIVPYMNLKNLFYLPSLLCLISASILYYEYRKQIDQGEKEKIERREEELREEEKRYALGV